MRGLFVSLFILCVGTAGNGFGVAAPMVAGYERFYNQQPTADGGRLLYHELGCVRCHGAGDGLPDRRGPVLAGVTARVHFTWLDRFLADPASMRTGTSMPRFAVFRERDAREAVLHYLASLDSGVLPKPLNIRHVNGQRGKELFHTIGCVACHAPEDLPSENQEGAPELGEVYPSVLFPKISEKYSLSSLAEFLMDPLRWRPDGRMPKISLTPEEAVDLAGYLLDFQGSDGSLAGGLPSFRMDPDLVTKGRAIVKSQGCVACHEFPTESLEPPEVTIQRLDHGCLSESMTLSSPHYTISAYQRSALQMVLGSKRSTDPEISKPAQLKLALEALNCLACHERDGKGGPDLFRGAYFLGDPDLGDVGRIPPPLTGVGRKLQPAWLEGVLSGTHRVRPYLKVRMPVYPEVSHKLAAQFEVIDSLPEPDFPRGDAEAGRILLGTEGGLGCIGCHPWASNRSLGMGALDLSLMGQRLQVGWLMTYLVNPSQYRPGTLMPSFWPDGIATLQTIHGGDVASQIASIYAFALGGKGAPPGFPEFDLEEFELKPLDRPIVQRTFLEGVGTHAILVGFPSGTHLAYDGKTARPVLAWKGKFFDAYSTWFSRFAPFEKPAGHSLVTWPAEDDSHALNRFKGYRLDSKGIPSFLFSIDGYPFEERFEGVGKVLHRRIQWEVDEKVNPRIQHPEGVRVWNDPANHPGSHHFIYSWE